MKKFLLILLLVIISITAVGYLAIKGKIPIITNAVFKQIDLGIDETPETIYAFYDQIGFVDGLKGDTPKTGDLVFEGSIPLNHTFSQKEINSWISAWEESWTGIPFKNLQIKLYPDGTVEASSLISIKDAEAIGRTLGYTDEEINKAKTFLTFIPDPLPLYAKGTASVTNDVVSMNATDFKVANYTLPQNLTDAVIGVVEDTIERAKTMSDSAAIQSATVTSDGVKFVGTVPASVKIK